jgi:hypothetical protein
VGATKRWWMCKLRRVARSHQILLLVMAAKVLVTSIRAKTRRCRSSQIPPPPANKFKPQAKRSAAKEDEDRKKSMKNEEEEHVFVGEKEVPPIKEEDKAPVEPVSIPIKSRLPPPDEK